MPGNIFEQITASYNDMPPSGQKISNYLLQHKRDIQALTISQLAEACDVSSATLTRYVRSLGYKSFNAFRTASYIDSVKTIASVISVDEMIDLYSEVNAADSIETKCQKLCHIGTESLQQTQKNIDPDAIREAVNLLWQARSVYCFGQGNSSAVAFDAWSRFVPITTKFHWISDSHLQANTSALLDEDEVVLYFSFSGATRELVENAKLIHQTRGKLILITRFLNSPGTKYADIVLLCGTNESPENQGSIAAKIGQLLIIDLLFNEYCSKDKHMVITNQKKTLEATEDKMLRRHLK